MRKLVPKMETFARYFDAEVRGMDRVPKSPVLADRQPLGRHHHARHQRGVRRLVPRTWFRRPADGSRLRRDLRRAWMARAHAEDRPDARQYGQRGGRARRRLLGAALSGRLVRGVPTLERSQPHRLQRSQGLHPPGAQGRGSRGPGRRPRRTRDDHRPDARRAFREAPELGQGAHGRRAAALSAPWGVSSPALPGVPLPAKITVQVCEPLDWSRFGPEGADDPDVLEHCYEEITSIMQATLDRARHRKPATATQSSSFGGKDRAVGDVSRRADDFLGLLGCQPDRRRVHGERVRPGASRARVVHAELLWFVAHRRAGDSSCALAGDRHPRVRRAWRARRPGRAGPACIVTFGSWLGLFVLFGDGNRRAKTFDTALDDVETVRETKRVPRTTRRLAVLEEAAAA